MPDEAETTPIASLSREDLERLIAYYRGKVQGLFEVIQMLTIESEPKQDPTWKIVLDKSGNIDSEASKLVNQEKK